MAQTETRFIDHGQKPIKPVNQNTPGMLFLQALAGGAQGHAARSQEERKAQREATAATQQQEMAFLSSIGSSLASNGQLAFTPSYQGQQPLFQGSGNTTPVYTRPGPRSFTLTEMRERFRQGQSTAEEVKALKDFESIRRDNEQAEKENRPINPSEARAMMDLIEASSGAIGGKYEKGEWKFNFGNADFETAITNTLKARTGVGGAGSINRKQAEAAIERLANKGFTTEEIRLLSLAKRFVESGQGTPDDVVKWLEENSASSRVIDAVRKGKLEKQ